MLVRLPSRFILVLLLLTFQYLLAIGCGQADPPEQSKPVGSTDARPADASEPAAAPGDPTPIEPDPIRDALDLALDQYRTIDQQARTVQAQALDPLIQRAAQAGDLDSAKRLTATRDSVIAGEISLPPAPELAATWHQAARLRAAAVSPALAAYATAIDDYTRDLQLDRATTLTQQLKAFQDNLPFTGRELDLLASPGIQYLPNRYEIIVDARENNARGKVTLEQTFQTSDVIYLFPNPDDTWYTGRFKWCDWRGRPNLRANQAPTMRLKRVGPGIPGRAIFPLGERIIPTQATTLSFYCEDRWPESNQGSIRVTVIVLRPIP